MLIVKLEILKKIYKAYYFVDYDNFIVIKMLWWILNCAIFQIEFTW